MIPLEYYKHKYLSSPYGIEEGYLSTNESLQAALDDEGKKFVARIQKLPSSRSDLLTFNIYVNKSSDSPYNISGPIEHPYFADFISGFWPQFNQVENKPYTAAVIFDALVKDNRTDRYVYVKEKVDLWSKELKNFQNFDANPDPDDPISDLADDLANNTSLFTLMWLYIKHGTGEDFWKNVAMNYNKGEVHSAVIIVTTNSWKRNDAVYTQSLFESLEVPHSKGYELLFPIMEKIFAKPGIPRSVTFLFLPILTRYQYPFNNDLEEDIALYMGSGRNFSIDTEPELIMCTEIRQETRA